MNTSSPASFILPLMPNSCACLMLLTVSAPAFARPRTLAPDACACSSTEEKSVVPGNGYLMLPSTLPPASVTKAVVSRCSAWPKA